MAGVYRRQAWLGCSDQEQLRLLVVCR